MDVGALVRRAREDAWLSQAELAARAGTTQPALSRIERGVRAPSLAVLDRLLAACGVALAGSLVPRHQDLHAELDRLAAQPVDRRLSVLDANPGLLLRPLLDAGCRPVVGGGWAAAAHGLPVGRARTGLLVLPPERPAAVVAALCAVPRPWQPRRWVDGEPAGWPITEDLFAPGACHRWTQRGVGEFRTRVLREGEPGPPEERLDLDGQELRVLAAVALDPGDGVTREVLDVFLAWRAERADRAERAARADRADRAT